MTDAMTASFRRPRPCQATHTTPVSVTWRHAPSDVKQQTFNPRVRGSIPVCPGTWTIMGRGVMPGIGVRRVRAPTPLADDDAAPLAGCRPSSGRFTEPVLRDSATCSCSSRTGTRSGAGGGSRCGTAATRPFPAVSSLGVSPVLVVALGSIGRTSASLAEIGCERRDRVQRPRSPGTARRQPG